MEIYSVQCQKSKRLKENLGGKYYEKKDTNNTKSDYSCNS